MEQRVKFLYNFSNTKSQTVTYVVPWSTLTGKELKLTTYKNGKAMKMTNNPVKSLFVY